MKDIIKHGLILFLIVFVCSILLLGVNSITADKIMQNKIEKENSSLKIVLSNAESFNIPEEGIYEGLVNDEVIGYAVTSSAVGYNGEIKILVGINLDGKILGVSILEMSETAGVGTKANDPNFLNQFINKKGEFKIVTGSSTKDEEISAISGATVTTEAVALGVNKALATIYEKGYIKE